MDTTTLATQAADIAKEAMPTVKATGEAIVTWLQSGVDLAKEQTPFIVHEALIWGIFQSLFWVIFSILCMVLPGTIAYRCLRANWVPGGTVLDKDKDLTGWGFIGVIAFVAGVGGGTIVFLVNAFNLGFVYFAPRLYLIQYLAALVHGGCGK